MRWQNVSRKPWPSTVSFEAMTPQSPPIPSTLQRSKEFLLMAADADWRGDTNLAQRYRYIASVYRQRHDSGDLYDPPF